jgi:hypothetical protein
MICPICKTDITEPEKQFGGKVPICQSCHLEGLEWAVEDEFLLTELQHGASLQSAIDLYHKQFSTNEDEGFIRFMWQLSLAIEDR